MPGKPDPGARPASGRNLYLWAFLLGIVVLTLMRPCLRRVPAAPPAQGKLPRFTFVDAAGRPFGNERLEGSVWIVQLFYVGCGAECAGETRALAEMRRAYAGFGIDGIRVLSLSVDPGRDTPEALHAFEVKEGPDPERWLLATGRTEDLDSFARGVFGPWTPEEPAPGGAPAGDPALGWLARAGRLALVDPDGGLRGLYASDASGIDEVYNRAQHVRDLYHRR